MQWQRAGLFHLKTGGFWAGVALPVLWMGPCQLCSSVTDLRTRIEEAGHCALPGWLLHGVIMLWRMFRFSIPQAIFCPPQSKSWLNQYSEPGILSSIPQVLPKVLLCPCFSENSIDPPCLNPLIQKPPGLPVSKTSFLVFFIILSMTCFHFVSNLNSWKSFLLYI